MINTDKANLYCKDDLSKIENYDKAIADTSHTWDIHHRLELTLDGEFAHTREELKRLGMYYHRPYFELIFLTHSEHQRLHNPFKGKHHSEESKQKMRNAMKGRSLSAETRQKIANANKGRTFTTEHIQKISDALKAYYARRHLTVSANDVH